MATSVLNNRENQENPAFFGLWFLTMWYDGAVFLRKGLKFNLPKYSFNPFVLNMMRNFFLLSR
jgi:hypothetical protein